MLTQMTCQGWWRLVLVVSSLALPAYRCNPPGCGSLPQSELLNMPLLARQMNHWCWAASAEMIMQFLGGQTPRQCDMATIETNQPDCCVQDDFDLFPDPCNNGGWPPFQYYGYTSARTHDTALTFAEIREQIYCKRKPVAFSWRYLDEQGKPTDTGHMCVAVGYSVDPAGDHVQIHNPSYATVEILRYEEYVGVPGQTTHWDDFYDITKATPAP